MAFFKFPVPVSPVIKAIAKNDLAAIKKYCQEKKTHAFPVFKCTNLGSEPSSTCDASLLDLAAGFNKPEIVEYLLGQNKGFNIDNALYFASQNGHSAIVSQMLKSSKNPNRAFHIACAKGHLDIVRIFLDDKRVDPSTNKYNILKVAYEANRIEVVKLLLEDERVDLKDCYSLLNIKNDDAFLNIFLNTVRLTVEDKEKLFYYACIVGLDEPTIKRLFVTVSGVYACSTLYRIAMQYSNYQDKILEIVLADPRMIPHMWYIACIQGHEDIIKKLLEDKDIKPERDDSYALFLVCASGYSEQKKRTIARLLLNKGANPVDGNYRAIRAALGQSNYGLASELVSDARIDPTKADYKLIFDAYSPGFFNERISVEIINNQISTKTSTNVGAISTVAAYDFRLTLLKDPRVNAKTLFDLACHNKCLDVVGELLKKFDRGSVFGSSLEAFGIVCRNFDPKDHPVVFSIFETRISKDVQTYFKFVCEKGYLTFITIFRARYYGCSLEEALLLGCIHGHVDVVTELLKDEKFDLTANNNQAARCATKNGHVTIVQLLLQHPKANTETLRVVLSEACETGQFDLVAQLRASKSIDPTFDDHLLIRKASQGGGEALVKELLNNPYIDPTANQDEAIRMACQNGHLTIVRMLLSNPHVDPTTQDNVCVYYACERGDLQMVRLLLAERSFLITMPHKGGKGTESYLASPIKTLLERRRVDSSACEDRAFRVACEKGYVDIVLELLKDDHVNPGAKDNEGLFKACQNNHPAIVALLLNNSKVNPIANNYAAIRIAYEKSHFEIVEIFLKSRCILDDLTFDNDWLLLTACLKGHLKVVEFLLKTLKKFSCHALNVALHNAYTGNHVQIFEILLKDKRFDPTLQGNFLIRDASEKGNIQFVKLLLQDGRAAKDIPETAVCKAYENNHMQVFKLLLENENVDPALLNNLLIYEASNKNDIETVTQLLKDPRVQPTDEHCALKAAYSKNHVDIFNLLLIDSRTNVAFEDNWLICEASKKNDIELVKKLLNAPSVNPTDNSHNALKAAYSSNHANIFNLLLEAKRADITFEDNWLLMEASKRNDIELVNRLLREPQVIEKGGMLEALHQAYKAGNFEIVKVLLRKLSVEQLQACYDLACANKYIKLVQLLLEEPNFDPAYGSNTPIREACKQGLIKVVKLLLQSEKVDPTAENNEPIRMASKSGHVSIVEELLKIDDVDAAANDYEAISEACKNNHAKVVSRLLLERSIDFFNHDNLIDLAHFKCSTSVKLAVLRSVGLHFALLSPEMKIKINNQSEVMLPIQNEVGDISYVTSVEKLKNNWFQFDVSYLLTLYAAVQKPFINGSLDARCSTVYAKLNLQIKDKLSIKLNERFQAMRVQNPNPSSVYENMLELTYSIQSVNPTFYQHWLCCLGNDYLADSTQTLENDAIEIFKTVWQSTVTYIPTLEARLIQINEDVEKRSTELLEKILNTAECLKSVLDDNLNNMEVAVMGIISALQRKIGVSTTFDPIKTEAFLDVLIETFDGFSNIDSLSPVTLSCLGSVLNRFFYDYLKTTPEYLNRDAEVDSLEFKMLLKAFLEHKPKKAIDCSVLSQYPSDENKTPSVEQPTQNFVPSYNAVRQPSSGSNLEADKEANTALSLDYL